MRKALDNLGRGRDGISGGETRPGSECAFAGRVIAIHEM
jgi:hypothetical protein